MTDIEIGLLQLVIFTDLDGTLLDAKTYQPGPAAAALAECRKFDIPVVFVSSKTRAEMEELRAALDNTAPFVSENGCGIFLPATAYDRPGGAKLTGDYWCISKGSGYRKLVRALAEAAAAASAEVFGFHDLDTAQLAQLTGLTEAAAGLAKRREFDEPFRIKNETRDVTERLIREIELRGFTYTRGGEFHHITYTCDKGAAIRRLKDIYIRSRPEVKFAALGDALNDLPMLREVDYPFLVRRPDGSFDEEVFSPELTITAGRGPAGFNEAVFSLISTLGLK